jgi:serine/threonine protein kinase
VCGKVAQQRMAVNRPPTLELNTSVNHRYTIIAVVGQGGLGTVYQVRDDRARQTLALKETFDLSEGARQQFESEARWLKKLNHPNIPRVREYFQWHDRLYLVMDFISGENLEYKLIRNRQRPLPELDVLRWTAPICDALGYLHAQRPPIIHRDVKPANIIVTPNGRPALVDLGIAKELIEGDTRTATFIRKAGTEGYAPPEQYAGKGSTGPHSDIYSLGATMYHLLTGQVPASAVERAALDNQLIAPRKLNPMLLPETEAVIMRALAIRPADRFPSMREMSMAINEVIHLAETPPFASATMPTSVVTSGPLLPFNGVRPTPPGAGNTSTPPELAPTLLRPQPPPMMSAPPAPQSAPRRQRGGIAIERPRDRRASSSSNGNGYASLSASSSLPSEPNEASRPHADIAASPPAPPARRPFPWVTLLTIGAILLILFGVYLGTRDYWPQLFGIH